MAPLSTSIEAARPPARPSEEVFSYVTDPTRFAEWQANVLDGLGGGQPPSATSRRWLVRPIGTRRTVPLAPA
jgi:hypothetical protein